MNATHAAPALRRIGPLLMVCACAWLGGIAWQLRQAEVCSRTVAIVLSIAGAGLLASGARAALYCRSRAAIGCALAAAVGSGLLAFGSASLQAASALDDVLPASLEGRDLLVTGVVASLPQRSVSGLRFRFDVEAAHRLDDAQRRPVALPSQLALGWYRANHEDAIAGLPRGELRAGQRWRFALRLRRPHGLVNPHGYDYELYLLEQRLGATGSVREAPAPVLLDRAAGHPVERLRQRVRDAIEARVEDRRAAGLLAALAVGDQGAIERADWDLYRNTGVAHLVSISGLHITMFAWLTAGAVAALWRRCGAWPLRIPTPLAARAGGLLAAAGYALFSGWGVPSQRTVWMLATVALLQSLGVRWPWLLVLLLAAVVVTLGDPWALLQAGFWLSFMAVGLLMASAPAHDGTPAAPAAPRTPLRRLVATMRDGLRSQVIASVGLAPLSLVFFQQVSVVGLFSNLLAIPLITLVITPLALLGAFWSPLWLAGACAIDVLNGALTLLARWPAAVLVAPAAPPWAQAAALLGAALLMLPLPWRARLLGLPLLLALAAPPRGLPPDGAYDLIALDVGQGTAVLVRTRAHLLVFDAGPQYAPDSDAGQRVLLPALRGLGANRIDRLVLSHRDADHVGGARSLFGGIAIDALSSSLEPGHPLLELATNAQRCEAGQRWQWDGVDFELLHPAAGDYARALKSNAMSCVLRVRSRAGAVALLTGDIEREQEAQLVGAQAAALRSDVLIVPHHGSRTSSTDAFIAAVAPRVAIVQAGYRNRFGHPAADVVERYRARGIRVVETPACGAWRWRAGRPDDPGDAPSGEVDPAFAAAANGVCQRDDVARYWQHRDGLAARGPSGARVPDAMR